MSTDKMSSFPWSVSLNDDICSAEGETIFQTAFDVDNEVDEVNMAGVVAAVNATYGQGINPKAIPDMLEALKEAKRMYEAVQPTGGWQGVYESIKSAIEDAKQD
jgi:hypothetical protein